MMHVSSPVRLKSIKHNIRDWTVNILKENIRIIHDTNEQDMTIKLDRIKHNTEMILQYLTVTPLKENDTDSNQSNTTLWDLLNLDEDNTSHLPTLSDEINGTIRDGGWSLYMQSLPLVPDTDMTLTENSWQ